MRTSLWVVLVMGCASSPAGEPAPATAEATVDLDAQDAKAQPTAQVGRKKAPNRRKTSRATPSEQKPEPEREPEPARELDSVPPVTDSNRCITGAVRARGALTIAVKNARVMMFRGTEFIGETRTDENGKFAWCAAPSLAGAEFEITVRVSKEPFQTISQSRTWRVGIQEEFEFALVAPSF